MNIAYGSKNNSPIPHSNNPEAVHSVTASAFCLYGSARRTDNFRFARHLPRVDQNLSPTTAIGHLLESGFGKHPPCEDYRPGRERKSGMGREPLDSAETGRACGWRPEASELHDAGRGSVLCREPRIQSGAALMSKLASHSSTPGNCPRTRRRTRRIALTVPLEVSGHDVERSSFTLTTTATSLNRNGAALHLNRDLSVGSVLVVQNSRGTRTSARVVAQTPSGEGVYNVRLGIYRRSRWREGFLGHRISLIQKIE